jgi:murein DD-endopeptidase MepM/ murein hydrolase activator NlpD
MRENRNARTGAKDPFIRLTAVQVLCCVLVLALAAGAVKLGGGLAGSMRGEYADLMEKDLDPGGFRFFSRRAADATEAAVPEEPVPAENAAAEENTDGAAGGADLSEEEARRALSFAFYESGERAVMPVNGVPTSSFGERTHPVYGTRGFHSGKDIAAPEGTPVYAALDGEVIAAGRGESSGNYVKLSHADGLQTLYCHLCAANVSPGVRVRRGDVIGFVGQTGLATGPHLHFEVQMNGVKYDPDHLLEGAAVVS